MNSNLTLLTIKQLEEGYLKNHFSHQDVFSAYQKQIAKTQPLLNAYITLTPKPDDGPLVSSVSPLNGVPFALKDNICTKHIKTTCASSMLKDFIPFYSATVYERLEQAGALLLGKNNMDEFSMGATTESSFFGSSKNPWNLNYVPGGSSGGGAAAVARGCAAFALGSDTGGSVRQPASFSGVVGFKPTYGHISRYGVIAFASSLDQIGTFTKTVEDCASVMNAISGRDSKDATTLSKSIGYSALLGTSVKGMTLGIPKEFLSVKVNSAIHKAMEEVIRLFTTLGVHIKEISLPIFKYLPAAYYIISSVEAASNLARFDGIRFGTNKEINSAAIIRREGFGREVKRRIMLGTLMTGKQYRTSYYEKALEIVPHLKTEMTKAYQHCDAIISPVSPATAPLLGEKRKEATKDHPGDLFTVPANLAGLPALSLPIGFDEKGLPIGLHLMGAFGKDAKVLQLGHTLEKEIAFPFWEVEKRWL